MNIRNTRDPRIVTIETSQNHCRHQRCYKHQRHHTETLQTTETIEILQTSQARNTADIKDTAADYRNFARDTDQRHQRHPRPRIETPGTQIATADVTPGTLMISGDTQAIHQKHQLHTSKTLHAPSATLQVSPRVRAWQITLTWYLLNISLLGKHMI